MTRLGPAAPGQLPEGLGLFGRRVGYTLARQSATVLVSLGLVLFLARSLGSEGAGAYSVSLLLPTFLAIACSLGIPSANVFLVGRRRFPTRRVVRDNLRLWAVLSVVGLVLGVALVAWLHDWLFPGVAVPLLWLALATFPVTLLQLQLLGILHGVQDFAGLNLSTALIPVVGLVAALILVGGLGGGVGAALLAYGAAQVAGAAAATRYVRRHLADRGLASSAPTTPFWRQAVDYGWRANVGNLVALLNYRIDLLGLNMLLGASAAGVYAVAVQFVEKLWLIAGSVSTVLLPRIAELEGDEAARLRLTPLLARWSLLVTLVAAVALGLVAPWLAEPFGPEFAELPVVLLCLLPGAVVLAHAKVLANDLAGRGRPGLNALTALLATLVEVGGLVILVPRLGTAGAGVASSVAYGAQFAVSLHLYGRVSGSGARAILRPSSDDRRLIQHAVRTVLRRFPPPAR